MGLRENQNRSHRSLHCLTCVSEHVKERNFMNVSWRRLWNDDLHIAFNETENKNPT